MRFLTISYDTDEQLAHFDMCNAASKEQALEKAGDLRPDCLPICALTVRELRATATQLNKAKDSTIAKARAAIWAEQMKEPEQDADPSTVLVCPQCNATGATFYDGALGYEGIRCNAPDCWLETDANKTDSFSPRTDKPRPEIVRGFRRRTGCRHNVCTCHMDPKPAGFTCSHCGCQVLRDETKP